MIMDFYELVTRVQRIVGCDHLYAVRLVTACITFISESIVSGIKDHFDAEMAEAVIEMARRATASTLELAHKLD